jgi:hypothetical protein
LKGLMAASTTHDTAPSLTPRAIARTEAGESEATSPEKSASAGSNVPRFRTLPLSLSTDQNSARGEVGVAAQRSSSEFGGSSYASEQPTPGLTPRTDLLSPRTLKTEIFLPQKIIAEEVACAAKMLEEAKLNSLAIFTEKENLLVSSDGNVTSSDEQASLLQALNEMELFRQQVQMDVAFVQERGAESLEDLLPKTHSWAEESGENAESSVGSLPEVDEQEGQSRGHTDGMQIYISSRIGSGEGGHECTGDQRRAEMSEGAVQTGGGSFGSRGYKKGQARQSVQPRPLSASAVRHKQQRNPALWMALKEPASANAYAQAHTSFTQTALPREGSNSDQSSRLSMVVGSSITPSTWGNAEIHEENERHDRGVFTTQASSTRRRPLSARVGRPTTMSEHVALDRGDFPCNSTRPGESSKRQ